MATGGTYAGTAFEDDIHLIDYVHLAAGTVATPIGVTATDLTVDNVGGTGPSCPDNFTMLLENVVVANLAASSATVTIQRIKGTGTPVPIYILPVAAGAAVELDQARFKLIAYPGWRFQVVSSVAASVVINGDARLIKGASQ